MAEQKLAKMKTSTRTREDLQGVEEEIAREQAKVTWNYTMEVFRRKQAVEQEQECGHCLPLGLHWKHG